MRAPNLIIISDGKPGHLAQSRGLAEAIARLSGSDLVQVDVADAQPAGFASDQPVTGVVIAAGRPTHQAALRLAKSQGLLAIALMNPGWWCRWRFDLCVIPRHDGIAASDRVIVTEGALNGIRPATHASPDEALLLVGGPSKHYGWDDALLARQIAGLLDCDPPLRWTATSSRRTPLSANRQLQQTASKHSERFAYMPAAQTPRGWVAEQLERCGVCWVTQDSVSMVYEALTAGARVGLLDVPRVGKPGRVVRGVQSLVERGWVTVYGDWLAGAPLVDDRPALFESDRVASVILERWPTLKP